MPVRRRAALRRAAADRISTPAAWARSRCLAKIHEVLRDVIAQHQPTVCVVEGLFFAQNLQTALTMGEARGAALVAAAEAGLEIYEIATRKVKRPRTSAGPPRANEIA